MRVPEKKRPCVFGCDQLRAFMHGFPHPEKKPELFKNWLSIVGDKLKETDPWKIFKNKKVCDHHFTPDQKVTGHRLIYMAVPTANLDGVFMTSCVMQQLEHNYCLPNVGGTAGYSQPVFSGVVPCSEEDVLLYILTGFGVTAGAHRLWAHRSYKAKLPLQILLTLFQTMSCQKSVLKLHHKYMDTDADPHNSTRGMFYSHIGWLMVKKHPEVIRRGKTIDMSDLMENPVLQFQKKYYLVLMVLLAVIHSSIPVVFWQESIANAHCIFLLFLVFGAHVTSSVNSIAHAFGNKPYENNISPTQNLSLTLFALGEGYHNYHHVFPFDYRVSELGNNYFNLTTKFIDFFAWLGWAYGLKYASDDMITKRANRTGDGTDLWGRLKEEQNKLLYTDGF